MENVTMCSDVVELLTCCVERTRTWNWSRVGLTAGGYTTATVRVPGLVDVFVLAAFDGNVSASDALGILDTILVPWTMTHINSIFPANFPSPLPPPGILRFLLSL